MSKKIKILFLLILSHTLISCEKQTLEPEKTSPPVFFVEGFFNGIFQTKQAGINDCLAKTYNVFAYDDSLVAYHFLLTNIENEDIKYFDLGIMNYTFPLININADIDSTIKPGKFNYASFFTKPGNPKRLKEIFISWYNNKNELYSPYHLDQKYSSFEIINVSDTLILTPKGLLKYKLANILFSCRLKNWTKADTINITNGRISAIFAK